MMKKFFLTYMRRACGTVSRSTVVTLQFGVVALGVSSLVFAMLVGVYFTQEIGNGFSHFKFIVYVGGPLLVTAFCSGIAHGISKMLRLFDELESKVCR